jgi:hypothetical protein
MEMKTGNVSKRTRKTAWKRTVRAFLQKRLDDILVIAGSGMIVYGVSLIHIAAAWITGGLLCMAIAGLIALGGRR